MTKYREGFIGIDVAKRKREFLRTFLVFSTPISERPEAEGSTARFGGIEKGRATQCSRPGRTA